jgi:hypothetical protein
VMTEGPFRPGADLQDALEEVAARGFAFVSDALTEPFRLRLEGEIHGLAFERAPEVVGEVRQETEAATLPPDLRAFPAIRSLRDALLETARASGVRGLRTWDPNDVSVQRYTEGSVGITSHRDGKRFRRLVAVVSVTGTAIFAFREDRRGEVLASYGAGPRSLILLRGPGLAGARDGRPFHEVSGPREGVRSSIGVRMRP